MDRRVVFLALALGMASFTSAVDLCSVIKSDIVPDGCTLSSDCSKITCEVKTDESSVLPEFAFSASVGIEPCAEPANVKFSAAITAPSGLDPFEKEFEFSGDSTYVAIPGLAQSVGIPITGPTYSLGFFVRMKLDGNVEAFDIDAELDFCYSDDGDYTCFADFSSTLKGLLPDDLANLFPIVLIDQTLDFGTTCSSNPDPNPNPNPDPNPSSGCFTGNSELGTATGNKLISDVQVSDYVLSSRPDGTLFYDKVFRITHFAPEATPQAVRITTKSGRSIELTPNHYLHAGACCDPSKLTLAGDIKVGDTVFVTPDSTEATSLRTQAIVADEVTAVQQITAKGTYNVHTLSSNVVVNGVAASHFTTEGDKTFPASWRNVAPVWYQVLDKLPISAEDAKAGH